MQGINRGPLSTSYLGSQPDSSEPSYEPKIKRKEGDVKLLRTSGGGGRRKEDVQRDVGGPLDKILRESCGKQTGGGKTDRGP